MSLSHRSPVRERLKRLLEDLSESQKQAATFMDGVLLVDAGAGSGKTRAVAYRIAFLLLNGVKSRHVLAATFTKHAAANLQRQVRRLTGADVKVCTLHSWAQTILQRYGGSPFQVLDEAAAFRLIAQVLQAQRREDLTHLAATTISRLKNLGETPDSFKPPEHMTAETAAAVRAAWMAYESVKAGKHLLDFDDLGTRSVELLHSDPTVLAQCHQAWRHVMVDEFQDTNLTQYALIRTVFEGRPITGQGEPLPQTRAFHDRSLAVVGDADQAVYAFRGGNVRLILGYQQDYPGCKVVQLGTNYRSQARIVEAARALISHNLQRTDKPLHPHRLDGHPPRMIEVSSFEQSVQAIAAITRRLWAANRSAEVTVLFRHNNTMEEYRSALSELGIPVKRTAGTRFEELQEVRDVYALVTAARDPRNDFKLLEAAKAVLPQDSRLPYGFVQRVRLANERGKRTALWDLVARAPEPEAVALRNAVLRVKAEPTEFMQVLTACHQTSWLAALHRDSPAKDNAREIQTELCRRLLGRRRSPGPLKSLTAPTRGYVELMTCHKSKGLERAYVFIPALEEGEFPDRNAADIEEERRLLYVAMTRARNQLFLVYDQHRPSRFLNEIPEGMATRCKW
jgi:DNA helicase-2/ATP-dependent DNA helicase PcrA